MFIYLCIILYIWGLFLNRHYVRTMSYYIEWFRHGMSLRMLLGVFLEDIIKGCYSGYCQEHLVDGIVEGHASAVLAASIFHFGEFTIGEAKAYMAAKGVKVRP